ncbi:MAG: sulfatase-like hydrolase/transferase, partial [Anaerolineales bacterium]|nr:sulfatase-like hydrolase/transferase [Anaerolineales bacterium]
MKNNPITRRDFLKLLGATGFFTLGHSLVGSVTGSTNRPTSAHPNVLILLFDALSAVDMSFYGYPRPTTPNFERFTQKATVFHRHYATGSFTTPGTASLLTGVLPWTHRAINLQGTTSPQFQDNNLFSLIPTEYQTFAYTHNSLAQILLDQFRGSIDDLHEISELAL